MSALKAEDGTRLTKRFDMERRVQEFYTSLFASKTTVPLDKDQREEEDVPSILISEVQAAVESLKAEKAPGPDAITRDRSIVSKIGTLYVSGGQFKSISDYPTLLPNPKLGIYPYLKKPPGTSYNVFLDLLAVQRVDDSGIKKYVAIPSSTQHQLPANINQVDMKLKALNITLSPFIYKLITSLANCTNQAESAISWWDNSAAQLMVQMQNNNTNGFCTTFENVESLYIISADSDQFFAQGLIDFQKTRPNTQGLSNYTICKEANADTFLTEFLTKISSNNLYSCETTYRNRFDIKLQSCLATYGFA
ncbi:unnamed protein product [Adineta steineri]|uniref:Uncharacterized protein n=2 Tax=Adineta steineri TaxID=433720 RepID=A0A814C3S0_9BILA|nr:unnamed protein product [Adineta steineri]